MSEESPVAAASSGWLNRTVWGMALTSFLSDLGHEAQSTLLPGFMAALGLPPAALGLVEGVADAASSFIKLGAGWISDRMGARKSFVVGGYLSTGLASLIMAPATGLGLVAGGKIFGWLGRGIRGPLRNAMLTDSIPANARGRAFGFHRTGDTLGAIMGPLAMVWFLSHGAGSLAGMRTLMAWTALPGILSALAFLLFVKERARSKPTLLSFRHALSRMTGPFRRYLLAVGLFGAGDFAHTLLILAASQLLAPSLGGAKAAGVAALLYAVHNAVSAAADYPAGALADRFGHRRVLACGYVLAIGVPLGLIAAFHGAASVPLFAGIFCLSGAVLGVQDTLESSATAGLVPEELRGLGFGVLGATNGIGDLISSAVVGILWTVNPALGFGYAAVMMAAGALLLAMQSGERSAL